MGLPLACSSFFASFDVSYFFTSCAFDFVCPCFSFISLPVTCLCFFYYTIVLTFCDVGLNFFSCPICFTGLWHVFFERSCVSLSICSLLLGQVLCEPVHLFKCLRCRSICFAGLCHLLHRSRASVSSVFVKGYRSVPFFTVNKHLQEAYQNSLVQCLVCF